MPPRSNRKALAHSERPLPAEARLLGELRPDEQLSVTFVLRTRPDGQPVPSLDHWGRTAPGQRRYLTVDQFAAIHGADPADISAVESFAVAHGMSVEESNAASTPQDSAAQFYLPALAAADILRLADDRYPGHALRLVDPHTIGCPADGVTFVPLPNGTALRLRRLHGRDRGRMPSPVLQPRDADATPGPPRLARSHPSQRRAGA